MLTLVTRQFQGTRVLVRLDPLSLQPVPGRRVTLPLEINLWTFSPGRSQLVFGKDFEPVLHVVDLRTMRRLEKVDLRTKESVHPIWWPAPRRLFALTLSRAETSPNLVMIDPVARRVLRRTPLAGLPQVVGRTPRAAVILILPVGPPGSIGPAEILVLDSRGVVRSVTLDEIQAGVERLDEGRSGVRTRIPGVAVDPDGGRAYVVGAGELVGEIDLATLRVTYHAVAGTASSPGEAEPAGLVRSARWVGDGRFAMWGDDRDLSQHTERSAGLALVDTRTWVSQILNERATLAWAVGGTIFAYGGFAFAAGRVTGIGLRAYGLNGDERFHLFDDGIVGGLQVFRNYGYVALDRPARVYVIDLRSGKILRRLVSSFAFSFFLMEDEPKPFAG